MAETENPSDNGLKDLLSRFTRNDDAPSDTDKGPFVMLDIVQLSGARTALPYAWLKKVDYNPPVIELLFNHGLVRIKGRNLLPLYRRIVTQRLGVLEEYGERREVEEGDPYPERVALFMDDALKGKGL